jgi:hypothetical protein
MGGDAEGVPFDGDIIMKMIETVKTTNDYEKKTLEEKMAFKADMLLEFTDKIVELVRMCFRDLPEFDPMFMGQHIRLTMERLFPDHKEDMQFRWIPYLLTRITADLFPVCIESSRYVPLRQAAFRLINEPGFEELPEIDRTHTLNINDGRMPPGVLGTHHSAWLLCDPLKGNEPLNGQAVSRFLEEQRLPSGTRPKNEEEIRAAMEEEPQ